MPSFESQSSSTSGSGSHSASLSTSTSCSSSHSDSADTRDASDYGRAEVVEDDDDDDDEDTLKLKNPSATGAPRTYTHSVGFPRYEDLFYRPPPRTSSRAHLGLGLRRRNRDARVLVPPPASHIHKHGCDCDFDGGYGFGYGKNDDGYDYAYARYDPRASPGVDEQLRELMYEMRDWVVENPEEAYKRLQVCLRVFVSRVSVSSCLRVFVFPCSYFLFSLFCLIVCLLPSKFLLLIVFFCFNLVQWQRVLFVFFCYLC